MCNNFDFCCNIYFTYTESMWHFIQNDTIELPHMFIHSNLYDSSNTHTIQIESSTLGIKCINEVLNSKELFLMLFWYVFKNWFQRDKGNIKYRYNKIMNVCMKICIWCLCLWFMIIFIHLHRYMYYRWMEFKIRRKKQLKI